MLTLIWLFHHVAEQLLPNSHQIWADGGTTKIKVNPTQVSEQMNHPVLTGEASADPQLQNPHLCRDEALLALVVALGPLGAAVLHVGAANTVLPRAAAPDVGAPAPVAARLLLRAGQRGVAPGTNHES